MQLKPSAEDQGVITKAFLKKLCRSDFKQYYSTPELNDILYLHYKGFEKIANLEEYTGLKVLYLEGNSIRRIEGLDLLVNLRCLYLHENLIAEISGLDSLTELVNLNLTDNMIERVSGLDKLPKLSNLQLKRNRLGAEGVADLLGLLACPSVSALDISDNKIVDEAVVPQVLLKLPNLAVLYTQNNEFPKKISHFRKALISQMAGLKYLDDKPVFEDELRYAMAWARGGLEEERRERALYKQEQEDKQRRQHEEFRAMLDRARQEARPPQPQDHSDSDSERPNTLETYHTPEDSHDNSEHSSLKPESGSQKDSEPAKSEPAKSERQPSEAAKSERQASEAQGKSNDLDELD